MANHQWLLAATATLLLSAAPAVAAGPRDTEFQTCMDAYRDAVRPDYEQHPEWGPFDFAKIARNYRPACRAFANSDAYPKNVLGVIFVAPGQFGTSEEAAPSDDTGAALLGSFLTGFLGGYAGGIVRAPHAYAPGPAFHAASGAHIAPVNPRPQVAPAYRPVTPGSGPAQTGGAVTSTTGGSPCPQRVGRSATFANRTASLTPTTRNLRARRRFKSGPHPTNAPTIETTLRPRRSGSPGT